MPIKGLTDRSSPILRSGGKLRLGRKVEKQKNGRTIEVPEKTDYFIFDPTSDTIGKVFLELYGDKPKELPIYLPSDDVEQSFPTAYKVWGKGTLVCYGDNQTGHVLKQGSHSERTDRPCSEACPFRKLKSPPADETKEQAKQRTCEPEGTLRVRIDGLPTMDHFEVTSRISSIIRLSPFLNALATQCEGQSKLHGKQMGISDIPLVLKLVPEKMEGYGEFYVLQLDIRESLPDVFAGVTGSAPAAEQDKPDTSGANATSTTSQTPEKPASPFTPEEQDEIRHLLPAVEANHEAPDAKAAARKSWADQITKAYQSGDKQTAQTVLRNLRVDAHQNAPGPRLDQQREAEELLGKVNQDTAHGLLVEMRSAADQETAEEILDRIRDAAKE